MTCPSRLTPLAWIENDLPYEESRLITTHVADCDECREKLALMNVVQVALQSSKTRKDGP